MPRKEVPVLLAAGAIALTGLSSALAPARAAAAPAEDRIVISAGHVDVASLVEDGHLVTKLKDSTGGSGYQMRDLDDVVLHVLPAAKRTMPDGFGFIAQAGQDVWLLPETSVTHIVWPGWSTEHMPVGAAPGGVQWRLDSVAGPGEMAVFQSDFIDGTTVLWNSSDGVGAEDSFLIGADKHVHGSWVFTQPGGYCLTSTRLANVNGQDQQVTSTLTFAVGDVDPLSVDCQVDDVPSAAPSQEAPPSAGPGNPTVPGEPSQSAAPSGQPGGEPVPSASAVPSTSVSASASPTTSGGEMTAAPSASQSATPGASASQSASVGPAPSHSPSASTAPSASAAPSVSAGPTLNVPGTPGGPGPSQSASSPAVWRVPNRFLNAAGATVLNDGHVDVASTLENGRLVTWIKDTTTGGQPIWRDPAQTILQALPAAQVQLPRNAKWSFIGATGTPVYLLPQKQRDGILWPGWSTEHIDSAATTGGIGWRLVSATGPGHVSVFDTDTFGNPRVYFATADGVDQADYTVIPKRTHAHGSWAFTAPGLYCLTMQRAAQLPGGSTASSNFTLALAVGETDVSRLNPATCTPRGNTAVPPPIAPPAVRPSAGANATPSATASTQACTTRLPVLDAGHIDYATRLVGGGIESLIGDDTGGTKVYREPAGTILWLKPGSEVVLPAGFGAVGAPGSTVWQIPQTQHPALIWLGWSTEALTSSSARGSVTWTVNSVEGPGQVRVFLSGAFGGIQEMVFNNGGSYQIPLGVHAHANWAFTAPGVYKINSTQTVQLASGVTASDTETMTIAVGDVDIDKVATTSTCGAPVGAISAAEAAPTLRAASQARASAAGVAGLLKAAAAPQGADKQAGAPVGGSAAATSSPIDPRLVPLLAALGALLGLAAAGLGYLRWRA